MKEKEWGRSSEEDKEVEMARFAVKSKGKFLQLLDVCNCSLFLCYKCLFWQAIVVAGHKIFCD
jgi:hypothetical protein